jgi:hypothetical protein
MPSQAVALKLSISVGKTDRIIHASAFLCSRLHNIIAYRRKQRMDNIYPSISEIKTTHFICFDVSFKPCVITAHEYVRQAAKGAVLGQEISFELKFNCDYLNDMYYEFEMPAVSCQQAPLGDIIVLPFDQNVLTANGNFPTNFGRGQLATASEISGINVFNGFSYVFVGVNPVNTTVVYNNQSYIIQVAAAGPPAVPLGGISYIYTDGNGSFIAGPDGTAVAPSANGFGAGGQAVKVQRANFVKAAELLGAKLVQRSSFEVDTSGVADYYATSAVNYRDRFLSDSICRNAYDLLIGQEVPYDYYHEKVVQRQTNVPGLGLDMGYSSTHREVTKVANGLQTPQFKIPPTTLYVPALFWFAMKRKDSIPVLCLPDADVRFNVQTAKLENLYYPAVGDTYIQETVTLINVAANSIINQNVVSQRRIPYLIPGSTVVASGSFSAHLNSCQIFLDDCVHTVLLNRIGFHLIRILRHNVVTLDQDEKGYEITGIKWPVEYVFVRDIPRENQDESYPYPAAENWWKCGHQQITDDQGSWCCTTFPQIVAGVPVYTKQVVQCHPSYVRTVTPAITQFGVDIYDTTFFDKRESVFYRQYIPYAYCNGYILSNDGPQFQQNIMYNFAEIPGYSNPNGHFNISKTRQITYQISATLGPSGRVDCISDAHCLNFIVISDGSLALRYI